MEGNPDISGCSTEQWEKHLTHQMKRHKVKNQMVKQPQPQAGSPDLYPTPGWIPYPYQGGRFAGVAGGIRRRGRGRRGPRGPPSNNCFVFCQPGQCLLWGPQGGQMHAGNRYPRPGIPPHQRAGPPFQAPYAAVAPAQGQ
ncbi:hypothetical protein FSCOSCO3_A010274 [Scomber scombrus]|uniref:Uncharacterized protein n=1 Tax=Scomber scombrus TaxID=13677 RepID=A0AAV1PSK7_SCOSC